MVRQMERSAIHVMAKRGKSVRQIAAELGRSPTTIARVVPEPVDTPPPPRRRRSKVEASRPQIAAGIGEGLANVRILERARADLEQPYRGGRTIFDHLVRPIRRERAREQAVQDVPIRFEGVPAEERQVDWGEVRRFPFAQQAPARRSFLACRLKDSRFSWLLALVHQRHAAGDAHPGAGGLLPGAGLGAVGGRLRPGNGHQRPGQRRPAGLDAGATAPCR
jgi:hypothetical protein